MNELTDLRAKPAQHEEAALRILTLREYEAWQLAERGLSQRTIALALNVSRSTVRSRLENARRKLATRKDAA